MVTIAKNGIGSGGGSNIWCGVETNTVAVTVELALKSCGLGLYHRIVGGSGMATIDQHFALPPFCESLGQHGHTQIISQKTPRIFAYSFTMVAYINFSCFRAKRVQAIFDLVLLLPFLSDLSNQMLNCSPTLPRFLVLWLFNLGFVAVSKGFLLIYFNFWVIFDQISDIRR